MAENVKTIPEEIREDSILRMIEHWQMEYQPESTVDPSSNGVPTGKAVANYIANYLKTYMDKEMMLVNRVDFTDNGDGFWTNITQYLKTTDYVDVRFTPNPNFNDYHDNRDEWTAPIHCDFSGVRFRINILNVPSISIGIGNMGAGMPYPFGKDLARNTISLQYTYFHPGNPSSFTKLHRTACVFKDKSDGSVYLYVSALKRSYISAPDGGGSANVNMDTLPTTDQKSKIKIDNIWIRW